MKKNHKNLALALLILCVMQSCATVFGGSVNAYQRTKPLPGQQQRRLRVGAFIADILLFWPGIVIDFATCAIYRPIPAEPVSTTPAVSTQK